MNPRKWILERANESDLADIYKLLKEAFFLQEPASRKLFERHGIPRPDTCLCLRALPQGLSFKVVVPDVGVVGAALNLCWDTLDTFELPDEEPNKSLMPFFDYIDRRSNVTGSGWLVLQVITVRPDWRRMGIAEALVESAEREALSCGFEGLKIVCTSHFTGRLVEKRGWKQVYKLPYSQYKGSPLIDPEPPHKEVTVYTIRKADLEGVYTSTRTTNGASHG